MLPDKITIVGAGVAGSYLAYLFSNAGYKVRIIDPLERRGCNCAWGVGFGELQSGYDHIINVIKDNTTVHYVKNTVINGVEHKSMQSAVILKPRFLANLTKDIKIEKGKLQLKNVIAAKNNRPKLDEVWINATGSPISTPLNKDIVDIPTVQYLIKLDKPFEETEIVQFTSKGYAWIFPHPVDQHFIHVGLGDFNLHDENEREYTLYKFRKFAWSLGKTLCECGRPITILPFMLNDTNPMISLPVGEALSVVHPSSGEGIVPALISADILFNVYNTHFDLGRNEGSFKDMVEDYTTYLINAFTNELYEYAWVKAGYENNVFKLLKYNKYVSKYIEQSFGIDKLKTTRMLPKVIRRSRAYDYMLDTFSKYYIQ